jgi:hypothetical protein
VGVELISIWFRRCSRFYHGLHAIGLSVYPLRYYRSDFPSIRLWLSQAKLVVFCFGPAVLNPL